MHCFGRGPAQQVLCDLGVPLQGKALAKTGAYALLDEQVYELPYTALNLMRSKLLNGSERLQFLKLVAGLSERTAHAARASTCAARVRRPGYAHRGATWT